MVRSVMSSGPSVAVATAAPACCSSLRRFLSNRNVWRIVSLPLERARQRPVILTPGENMRIRGGPAQFDGLPRGERIRLTADDAGADRQGPGPVAQGLVAQGLAAGEPGFA